MNTKTTASLLVLAPALTACTFGAAPTPSPTRAPSQPPTATPSRSPTSQATTGAISGPSSAPTGPAGSAGTTVDGRQFVSVSVTDNGSPRPLVQATTIRLAFQDGTLTASGGCNVISGNYSVEDGELVFSGASMTEMGCEQNRMAQDDWLIGILGSRPLLALDGDDLVLSADTTTITLLDRETAEPDQPLAGPTWLLTSIISGDAVSSVPAGVVATLTFGED